jgi:DNA-binding transcriptional MerR regulator
VFEYGDKSKAENVIVELERDGKKFVVGVHFNQNHRGIEVSDIRGLFNKDTAEWLNWVSHGKALYLNKEKIQALIDKQRTNLAEVEYLDLDSVAKVIESFENPTVEGEKDGVRFRFIGEKGAGALDKAEEATAELALTAEEQRSVEQSGQVKSRLGFIPSLPKNYEPIAIG